MNIVWNDRPSESKKNDMKREITLAESQRLQNCDVTHVRRRRVLHEQIDFIDTIAQRENYSYYIIAIAAFMSHILV